MLRRLTFWCPVLYTASMGFVSPIRGVLRKCWPLLSMSSVFRKLVALLAVLFLSTTAKAVILDWDTVTWTAGSLSNSYDVDPANAGNDVTVTVSGNTAQLQPELVAPNPQTPCVTTNFQGGLPTAENTLCLAVNFTNQTQQVTVTVDFSALYAQGVHNVSFKIFDVDFANAGGSTYQDQIRSITALSIDGVTQIAPTITTSPNNTLSGSGLSQVVTGNTSTVDTGAGSGDANMTIDFGTNAIKSVTFTYGSGSGTVADPTYQHIGLYDISFTPVPEINPVLGAIFSCVAAAGLVLFRHAKA